MVEFETLKAEKQKFGTKNFLEVARKVAKTEEGDNEFIAISRGFIANDGSERYTKSITIPEELVDFVCEKLKEMKAVHKETQVEESKEEKGEETPVEEPKEEVKQE